MTKPSTPTKAELREMLAEAVRNTQPQPVNPQPEPVRDVQREPKRKKALPRAAQGQGNSPGDGGPSGLSAARGWKGTSPERRPKIG